MEQSKKFDEITIMRVMAMTMIVAFHSMCFYNGRWAKVDAIMIPFWYKTSSFLDVIDLNMFVFISGYLYGYLYIFRNNYFPAFMIGYLCAKLRVGWLMPNWSYILLPFVLLLLYVLIWYNIPLPWILITLVRTLCGYTICIFLLIILSKVTMSDRTRRVFVEIERLSMGLYIFNQIAMDTVFSIPILHQWFEIHWEIGPFILFLIGFFPPMLLSYVFNKYKFLKWTIGG